VSSCIALHWNVVYVAGGYAKCSCCEGEGILGGEGGVLVVQFVLWFSLLVSKCLYVLRWVVDGLRVKWVSGVLF
jgi:hypothetical protein